MSGFDLTTSSTTIGLRRLGGGLNSTASPLALEDDEASDLLNVDFDRFGSVKKRNGYTQVNTSAFNSSATWTSLHWLTLSSGSDYLLGTCGNKLAAWSAGAPSGSPSDITGSLTITAGNNNLWKWTTFKDIAFGVNGVNAAAKWPGTGNGALMTAVAGMDYAKWIANWQNYVFLAYVSISGTLHPTRIYWSTINDPEAWNAADFNEIGFKDGKDITGLEPMGDRLAIFKEDSIWVAFFTGDADTPFIFQRSSSPVGCVSGYSIQSVKNGLVFRAEDGIYFFDGVTSTKLSDRVTTTLDTLSPSRLGVVSSAYQITKNRYWTAESLSGSSTHNRCVTWDDAGDAFSFYSGHTPNCFVVLTTGGQERIYFGDYAGFVYRADSGANDTPAGVSTAINAYWKSKWHDFGDISNQKGVPQVVVYHQANTATLAVGYSYDLATSAFDTVNLSTATAGAQRIDLGGRGRLTRIELSNATLSETFQVDGLGISPYLETQV